MFKYLLLAFVGLSFGALASSGVFTVLVAVGLVPRFAGKTHTSRYVLVYDETLTWSEIEHGAFSSQMGDYIPHYSIVTKFITEN